MVGKISQDAGAGLQYILQKEKTLEEAAGTSALHPKTSGEVVAGRSQANGDIVDISEQARKLAKESDDEKTGAGIASGMRESQKDDQQSGMDQVESIRKKIEEVKKKLQEAEARLAQAQAGNGKVSPSVDEDPAEAAAKAASEALTGSAETEMIQAEIKMLNQQLLTLNTQLQEAMEATTGGGQVVVGTAGLGGAGGPGGLGERMPINQ